MDVVVRAAIVFGLLWALSRLTGKRQLAQLSAFEFIVIVTVGDIVGPTIMQEGYSITAGFLAVGTFFVLGYGITAISRRVRGARPVLEGRPTVLVRNGQVDEDALTAENLHLGELMEAARRNGLRTLDDVDLALMEESGQITFLTEQSG